MTTQTQIKANRRNAKRSTGPKSDEGKAVIATNALKTGLFAVQQHVLPLLGEKAEDHQTFTAAAIATLDPVGPVESELAARIANLFWRIRRIPTFEVAASHPSSEILPADPALIEPQSEFTPTPPPATAPLADRLAHIRQAININDGSLYSHNKALECLKSQPRNRLSNDDECDWRLVTVLTGSANIALGRPRVQSWDEVAAKIGLDVPKMMIPQWTFSLLMKAFDHVAQETGRTSAAFRRAIRDTIKNEIALLDDHIQKLRSQEQELVEQMQTERIRVAAMTSYGSERAVAGIQRAESHLNRQVERSLALLEHLQSRRRKVEAPVLHRFEEPLRLAGPSPDRTAIGFVFSNDRFPAMDLDQRPLPVPEDISTPAPGSESVSPLSDREAV